MTQKIPSSKVVIREDGKFLEKDITEYFKGKKIVAFALPGAFTPTCSNYHVPAYEEEYENLKTLGIDEVYCISMNDPFVVAKWKEISGANKIKFIPDGNGNFTKDMNMISDRSTSGMGPRSFRYSMYVDDGNIIKIFKDEDGKFDVSDPKTMIKFLKETS
ncbi:redoxin family protein [Pelagibacteraceae bacterium]|nr:redoxin family protein [Pelagibacteraceae bacterium]